MAGNERNQNQPNKKRPLLGRYFFLEKQLHRRLFINRGKDLLTAWNYPAGKKATYNYSTVINRHKRAFTSAEVSQMINRKRKTIEFAMKDGNIKYPQYTYGLDENRNLFQYMWQEEEIMDLLDYLSNVHRGRPRNDGEITTSDLPTPRELRAMINDENVLYIKQGDTFVPTWRAKEI